MATTGATTCSGAPTVIGPVRTRRDFDALAHAPRRARAGGLWLSHVPGPGGDEPAVRLAFAIPAKVGTAVVRNRVRRRLRAALVDLDRAGEVAPGLYLVGATPRAARASYGELAEAAGRVVAVAAGAEASA